jgi:hypothetical protein
MRAVTRGGTSRASECSPEEPFSSGFVAASSLAIRGMAFALSTIMELVVARFRFASFATLASLAALVVVGCGGKAFVEDVDGGGDGGHDVGIDGGHDGDASVCAHPPNGCTRTSATTCQLDCNTCDCTNNGWACTLMGCNADAAVSCPSSVPTSGSFCPSNGESCGPWGPGCGPTCSCENHQWKCLYPPCPPPVCPPSPPSGSCNGEVGLDCMYGSGCNTEQCQCVAQGGGASWLCSGTACVDAGHTGGGDAGH